MNVRRIALAAVIVMIPAVSVAPGALAARVTPTFVPVRVLLAGGPHRIPLTGASVALRVGGRTVAVGRTYSEGLALVAGQRIPTRFDLRTTGGWIGKRRFGGHLVASVDNFRSGKVVDITPATTLSTRACRDLGTANHRRCDRRVRAFLRLPSGTDLGAGLSGELLFDGHRFLTIARRHGGVAPFLLGLARVLRRNSHRSYDFSHRESRRSVHARSPAVSQTRGKRGHVTAVGDDEDWLSSLEDDGEEAENPAALVGKVFGFIQGQESSAALSATLSSMQTQLTTIAGELKDLTAEVSALPAIIDQVAYTTQAGFAAGEVNAIGDAQSSFQAVLDRAVEIGCGEFTADPTKPPARCSDPQSPAQVCTASAEAANAALQQACLTFGDLPLPADAAYFYTAVPVAPAAQKSLVGEFVNEVTTQNMFNDAGVEALANQLGGDLGGGTGQGLMQLAAGHAAAGPFFTTHDSQVIQDAYDYYFNALLAGATMRIAYDAFDGIPSNVYQSPVSLTLADLRQLNGNAPQPLPGGTFIDTSSYRMWSDLEGTVEDQSTYLSQVKQGATLTLPTANPNGPASAGSVPRLLTLSGGSPASNWSAAQDSDLNTLYSHIPAGGGTRGDFLVGSANDSPALWPGLLSNGVWNASGYQVGHRYAQATLSSPGLSFAQSTDQQADGLQEKAIYSLDVVPCVAANNAACPEPAWASGAASGVYDLNNGGEPKPQPIYSDDVPGSNKPTQWDNWTSDHRYCVSGGFFGHCGEHRTYPQIVGFLKLPVLFDRLPANTVAECYYWPTSGRPTTGNGCSS